MMGVLKALQRLRERIRIHRVHVESGAAAYRGINTAKHVHAEGHLEANPKAESAKPEARLAG